MKEERTQDDRPEFSEASVRERAHEIAVADGRRPEEATDQDYRQAAEELARGMRPPEPNDLSEEMEVIDPAQPAVSRGRQMPRRPDYGEEESDVERLVDEGRERAERSQRVAAGAETLEEAE